MTSQQQADANRVNSQKSTGPKTAAGKAISSTNALKHGMHSRTLILSHEDADAYTGLCNGIIQQFAPRNQHEQFLCKRMASARWRLERLEFMETGLLDAPEIDTADLDRLSRWQVRMENSYDKAYKQLTLFRKAEEAARAKAAARPEAPAHPDAHPEPSAPAEADIQAKEKEIAEARAAMAEVLAAKKAKAEADEKAWEALDPAQMPDTCLYWYNPETGERTQVAGPPEPYDRSREISGKYKICDPPLVKRPKPE
jgi:hypothetical protein